MKRMGKAGSEDSLLAIEMRETGFGSIGDRVAFGSVVQPKVGDLREVERAKEQGSELIHTSHGRGKCH
jgi:hypothetical protein